MTTVNYKTEVDGSKLSVSISPPSMDSFEHSIPLSLLRSRTNPQDEIERIVKRRAVEELNAGAETPAFPADEQKNVEINEKQNLP